MKTDKELLDWLDEKGEAERNQADGKPAGWRQALGWVARRSTTGRGWRVHQGHTRLGHESIRDAINAAIDKEEQDVRT